jgi:hypothetical protein
LPSMAWWWKFYCCVSCKIWKIDSLGGNDIKENVDIPTAGILTESFMEAPPFRQQIPSTCRCDNNHGSLVCNMALISWSGTDMVSLSLLSLGLESRRYTMTCCSDGMVGNVGIGQLIRQGGNKHVLIDEWEWISKWGGILMNKLLTSQELQRHWMILTQHWTRQG